MRNEEQSQEQGFATETVPVEVGVVALNPDKYQPPGEQTARSALVVVEGADIRYWKSSLNGTAINPTLTEGFLVRDGGTIGLDSFNQIRRFRAIRVVPGTSVLQVEYSR